MRTRPDDLSDAALAEALRAWGIDARVLEYAPVGFGDHHWRVVGTDGRRWFVTVAEPARKPLPGVGDGAADALGEERRADDDGGFDALRRAMDTARALRDDGLSAVVAPETTAAGGTVVPVGARWALSVFAHVDGTTGDFAAEPDAERRRETIALLAELHAVAAPARAPRIPWDPPARGELEAALAALGEPWAGGPYGEPVRAALRAAATGALAALARFDAQVAALAADAPALVITHGEPHPGNLIATRGEPAAAVDGGRAGADVRAAAVGTGRLRLVDWDTVGLSVPERDLWSVLRDDGDLDLYERLTGHRPRAGLLDLFRLRWDLGDAGELLGWFRAPHGDGDDLADGWRELSALLERLGAGAVHTR